MKHLLEQAKSVVLTEDIVGSLQKLAELFPQKIVFSTSFSLEDQIISHYILTNNLPIEIFTLDTGRLFPETYQTLHNTNKRYNTKIKVYFPNHKKVEEMVNQKGVFSFYDSVEERKSCCFIRKVEPLNRALDGNTCWITGIRAEQSDNRQNMNVLEWDDTRSLVKYQPLLQWTVKQVEDFIKEHQIPYNPLHDQGFPSIGCQPCTRAVQPGEDIRAGRWWWEEATKKECGLHIAK